MCVPDFVVYLERGLLYKYETFSVYRVYPLTFDDYDRAFVNLFWIPTLIVPSSSTLKTNNLPKLQSNLIGGVRKKSILFFIIVKYIEYK